MRRYGYLAVFIIASVLNGCSTTPHRPLPERDAYWNVSWWQAHLFNAVQSAVHLPAKGPDASKSGIHGTVRFLFDKGVIENPEIVTSTGDADLDKLMLQQVASAKAPKPIGPHAAEPHEFELLLDMLTPLESFKFNIYAAIDSRKIYPREALLQGSTGSNTVGFDYLDGKATNIIIIRSSHSNALDKSSISAISNADLPAPSSVNIGKTVHLEFVFCYDLNTDKDCPKGENIIYVLGTRIRM
jgi:TonB family protein